MKILQTSQFEKTLKKLHQNQKKDLYKAINSIIRNPDIGDPKVGELKGISVYKFKMVKQLTLLGYQYSPENKTITLATIGSHENFYRDLKRS